MGLLSKILILLSFVAAAVVAMVMLRPPPEEVEAPVRMVRVAAKPLLVGTFLDEGKAPLKPFPEDEADPEAIGEAEADLIGAVIIEEVPEGRPVPRTAVLSPGQEGFLAAVLRPGHRAVSLAVDAVSGNAGHIFPGDHVDLLLTQQIAADDGTETSPARRWASETILRNVRVIAVDQKLGGGLSHRAAPEGAAEAAIARTITLEVSPDGAETIAVARNIGALSLTLRSLLVETPDGAPAETADETATRDPTWAGDVSAVTRAASGRPAEPEEQTVPTPVRPITVLRGGQQERVSQ